jgi:predicted class III extradiol MEMO1 family dioxygenase
VRRGDQRLLAQIEALNADAFYFEIARTKNSRHWDGVLAILALLGVGRDRFKSGRLLHYSQWLKPTKSVVSVAAMAFDQE